MSATPFRRNNGEEGKEGGQEGQESKEEVRPSQKGRFHVVELPRFFSSSRPRAQDCARLIIDGRAPRREGAGTRERSARRQMHRGGAVSPSAITQAEGGD